MDYERETQLSAIQRQLSTSQLSIASLNITHERALASVTSANTALSAQLQDYITKSERLERVNKSLMLQEREREENAREQLERTRGEQEEREEMREETNALRHQNELLKNSQCETQSLVRVMEHATSQVREEAKRERERAEGLESELVIERRESMVRLVELEKEKERRRISQKELERLEKEQVEVVNSEVVREELRREYLSLVSASCNAKVFSTLRRQVKSLICGHWKRRIQNLIERYKLIKISMPISKY